MEVVVSFIYYKQVTVPGNLFFLFRHILTCLPEQRHFVKINETLISGRIVN